jgi:pyrroloquinoline quinone biosynthesis protein E
MPTLEQLDDMNRRVAAARDRYQGILVIDYVVPDYYAQYPKPCMGGWGRRFLNVSPSGKVLPCHAAETIAELSFDTVRERSLADIWSNSDAFNRFRGTAWMSEPCRSCARKEIDWGGCRCQAFAVTGDAARTDPACSLSEHHENLGKTAARESGAGVDAFIYRRYRASH